MIRFAYLLLVNVATILVVSLSGGAQEPQGFPSPFKVGAPKTVIITPPSSGLKLEPPKLEPFVLPASPFKVESKPLLSPASSTPTEKPFGGEVTRRLTPPASKTVERVMDTKAFLAERAWVLNKENQLGLPRLGTDFEVLGESTPPPKNCQKLVGADQKIYPGTYNSLAHAAGIKNLWIELFERLDQWETYFKLLGYTLQATNNTKHEVGMQKVAVYGKRNAKGQFEYTHASIQEADGTWTSKLDKGPLIRHRNAESVNGPSYGEVVRVFVRKAPAK